MKKAYFLIVLFLCGLSVGNIFAAAIEEELLEAVRRGEGWKVEELIAEGADVNARNQYGETALTIAISRGNKNIVEQLLKANKQTYTKGRSR